MDCAASQQFLMRRAPCAHGKYLGAPAAARAMADPASHGFVPHLDVHCDDDSVLMRRDTRSAKACQVHLGAHLIEEWEHNPDYVMVSHGAFGAARRLHKAATLEAPARVGPWPALANGTMMQGPLPAIPFLPPQGPSGFQLQAEHQSGLPHYYKPLGTPLTPQELAFVDGQAEYLHRSDNARQTAANQTFVQEPAADGPVADIAPGGESPVSDAIPQLPQRPPPVPPRPHARHFNGSIIDASEAVRLGYVDGELGEYRDALGGKSADDQTVFQFYAQAEESSNKGTPSENAHGLVNERGGNPVESAHVQPEQISRTPDGSAGGQTAKVDFPEADVFDIREQMKDTFKSANERVKQAEKDLFTALDERAKANDELLKVEKELNKSNAHNFVWNFIVRSSRKQNLEKSKKKFFDASKKAEMAHANWQELYINRLQIRRELGKSKAKAEGATKKYEKSSRLYSLDGVPTVSHPTNQTTPVSQPESTNQTTPGTPLETSHEPSPRPEPLNQFTHSQNPPDSESQDHTGDRLSFEMPEEVYENYYKARQNLRKVATQYKPLYEDYEAKLARFKAKREEWINFDPQFTPALNQTSPVRPAHLQDEVNRLKLEAFQAKQKVLDMSPTLLEARKATNEAFKIYFEAQDLQEQEQEHEPQPESESEQQPESEPEQQPELEPEPEPEQDHQDHDKTDPEGPWIELLFYAGLAEAALAPMAAVYLRWKRSVRNDEGVLEENNPCVLIYDLHNKLSQIVGTEPLETLPSGSLVKKDIENVHAIQTILTNLVNPPGRAARRTSVVKEVEGQPEDVLD